LDEGHYDAELCMDGVNADSYASDYVIKKFTFKKEEPLKIKMAKGGGFVLKLIKK
jgi:alpha-glucosidase